VAWAISYLNKAQLLTLTGRGVYRITDRVATFLKSFAVIAGEYLQIETMIWRKTRRRAHACVQRF
jgi:restriction endonuclease Mrr